MGPVIHWGVLAPSPDLLWAVGDLGRMAKPMGGLWTSPVGAEYGWEQWCRNEMPHWVEPPRRPWLLIPRPGVRVLRIDSLADLVAAGERWPAEPGGYAAEWGAGVSWSAIAEDMDAVWLTERGMRATRFTRPTTYGWDCETVFWTRWCFASVAPLGDEPAATLAGVG